MMVTATNNGLRSWKELKMEVKILSEAGYKSALTGMGLSFGLTSEYEADDIPDDIMCKLEKTALKLANQDGGHNGFLEQIVTWLDITAPRYWWCQMDRYRVGKSQLSESTMHTLIKRELTGKDFSYGIHEDVLNIVNGAIRAKAFSSAKANLPESFLQRRIICVNYKTLRNIILQRRNHKLEEWQVFIQEIIKAEHHELLPFNEIIESGGILCHK